MATINFPSSPTTGQTYTFNSKTWLYNGTGWALQVSSGGGGSTNTNIDGGTPTSNYGGISPINGGTP